MEKSLCSEAQCNKSKECMSIYEEEVKVPVQNQHKNSIRKKTKEILCHLKKYIKALFQKMFLPIIILLLTS